MKRRDFLGVAGGGIISSSILKDIHRPMSNSWFDWFKTDTDRVLVIIQLEGGNDGLNTLIPLDQYDLYSKARSSVALPAAKILSLNTTNKTGFHPALDEIRGLYHEGKIKFIQSVGYPSPNYSHFRSTDIWMSGSDADEILSSGWAGRYLQYEYPNFPTGFPNEDMPDPLSVEIGYGQSLTFQGPATSMSVTIADPASFNKLIEGIETPLPNDLYGEKLGYVRLIRRQSNSYGERMKLAYSKSQNKVSYPDHNLADQLKIVARLIAGGLKSRVYKVSISGFDNHANQVLENDHTQGEHHNLLKSISSGVNAFLKDLEALGLQDRVIGMTISEFGRRIISNASRGTDHGAAAPLMLFGHAIDGGNLLGQNPTIPKEAKDYDNIPMQYDFRSVYGSILEEWFCVNQADVQSALTKTYQKLPIIKSSFGCLTTPTHEETVKAGTNILSVSPNPFVNKISIKLLSDGTYSMVSIFNPGGQIIENIHTGKLATGWNTLYWNSENLPTGNYYVRFQQGAAQQVKLIAKVRD
ncbi:MAG: DUF1501 domain-containing protein [Saprospiraceae bacterium]|nr:DUF1501 domain-containing protein [Saprospiraceae bacterium]